jgi:tetratricopeptide (TPR) repeat protein
MLMSRNRTALLVAATLCAGCRKVPVPAETASKHAAETRTSAGTLTGDESKALCLAEPNGAPTIDRQLRLQQKRARELPTKSDEWVLAGRQWVRKARLASDPGFYVNVDGCAAVALEVEPGAVPALELTALVRMNDHRFDEARQVAEDILGKDGEDFLALGTLSDALLELGRYDEAAEAAQRQMTLLPSMPTYSRGSYIRWLRGDTGSAKNLIKEALVSRDARDPEPAAWTFVEAAAIFWHQADYDGADAIYGEALKWVPDYPAALIGRGRIAIAKRQPRQAVDLLEKAYGIRPLPEAAWLIGDAKEMLGDAAGAHEAYDRVVRQGRRGDKLTLALFYATKNRDVEEAQRLIEEERRGRGGIYVDDVHSWVLFRAGRLAEARTASQRAIRLGTKDARLLYHAGAIRIASGEEIAGRNLVRQALALNPSFDRTGAEEARALLASEPRKMASR